MEFNFAHYRLILNHSTQTLLSIIKGPFIFLQGKHIGRLGHQDPGEFPEEVKALFEKAVQYYEDNMMLMVEIGDRAAQGRACGNLGNVHYLLGNFSRAIHFHQERLKIAKEFRYKNSLIFPQ